VADTTKQGLLSWCGEDDQGDVWMDDGFIPSLTEVRSPNSTSMLTYPQRAPRHCLSQTPWKLSPLTKTLSRARILSRTATALAQEHSPAPSLQC
jgi:hypothetical protein